MHRWRQVIILLLSILPMLFSHAQFLDCQTVRKFKFVGMYSWKTKLVNYLLSTKQYAWIHSQFPGVVDTYLLAGKLRAHKWHERKASLFFKKLKENFVLFILNLSLSYHEELSSSESSERKYSRLTPSVAGNLESCSLLLFLTLWSFLVSSLRLLRSFLPGLRENTSNRYIDTFQMEKSVQKTNALNIIVFVRICSSLWKIYTANTNCVYSYFVISVSMHVFKNVFTKTQTLM